MFIPRYYSCQLIEERLPFDTTLEQLFVSKANEEYLQDMLVKILSKPDFIQRNMVDDYYSPSRLLKVFIKNESKIRKVVDVLDYKLPYRENLPSSNPAIQLCYANALYLQQTAKMLVMNPDIVKEDYYEEDETGWRKTTPQQAYSPASYSNGYWDPLEDIKNRADNKHKTYWIPFSVDLKFDGKPRAGQKYALDAYQKHENSSPLFPIQQYSTLRRHFVSEIKDEEREAPSYGYDMSDFYE